MNKVILVGGVYGSGKSTLGHSVERQYHVIDYDYLIGDIETNGVMKVASEMDHLRQMSWGKWFLDALIQSALINPITVGLGTFTTRQRRDTYFDAISQVAEVSGLYYMLPMRETISRIRNDRVGAVKLVNSDTVLGFYRTHNRVFKGENHGDLILPENMVGVPKEYQALLAQSRYKPENIQRWLVITEPLRSEDISRLAVYRS